MGEKQGKGKAEKNGSRWSILQIWDQGIILHLQAPHFLSFHEYGHNIQANGIFLIWRSTFYSLDLAEKFCDGG